MAKQVAIGIQSFKEIREKDCFYIDKTLFIKEWWENGDAVTLITRPRRFGKTLNMSMVEQFFSVDYADRGDLFEGLDIWEDEKYRELQGTYPVIFLTFARVKENNFQDVKKHIFKLLKELYTDYSFLLESERLDDTEKETIRQNKAGINDVVDASLALNYLCKYLYKHYGKKVIILLDEYDTPMQEAYINGYWDELVAFTRSLFNATFKSNPYMERGIMTGVTRISKESIFSDLNNLVVITTTSNSYATAFGFTEKEVFASLEAFGLGEKKERVKNWYDGFVFGEHRDIYNPWSILNFLDTNGKFGEYWANTSSNGLVSKLIREGNTDIKEKFSLLLRGESVFCEIDEQIVYNQLDDNEEAVWSLLLAGGYLKVLSYDELEFMEDDEEVTYELALTNREVKRMFNSLVRGWFTAVKKPYNGFVTAMLGENLREMNIYINKISLEIFSYFDTGRRASGSEPERFYHGFVLGLIADLSRSHIITSNRESGYGRYNVMIEPKDKTSSDKAFILEFKVHEPDVEADIKETVAAALQQIEDKQYEASLIARGFEKEKIRKYGFAFEGKKVLIGEADV